MDFEPNVILIGCISNAHCTMNEFESNETCTIAILWLYQKKIRSSSIIWNFFVCVCACVVLLSRHCASVLVYL